MVATFITLQVSKSTYLPGSTESEFDHHIYAMTDITVPGGPSEIHLQTMDDWRKNSLDTKKLLDEYAAADKEFKDNKSQMTIIADKTAYNEHNKRLKSSKAKRDKLKNDIFELVMKGEVSRAGFTKTDKKPSARSSKKVGAGDSVPTFC